MSDSDAKPGVLDFLAGLFDDGRGNCALDGESWQTVLQLQLFKRLDGDERARLRELAIQLLADKAFSGAGGLEVDNAMATVIAAFAALPILNLGYDWYEEWCEIVIYPGEFVYDGEQMDEGGVMHHLRDIRSGEAMPGGPMVLSWQDVGLSGQVDGFNVVIHEFAHKLDMKNGDANGRPPLHAGMSPADWAHDFQAAWDDLCHRTDMGEDTAINPYATQSPAEFFAVLSEYFFELPAVLQQEYPEVYRLLAQFYRQEPLAQPG